MRDCFEYVRTKGGTTIKSDARSASGNPPRPQPAPAPATGHGRCGRQSMNGENTPEGAQFEVAVWHQDRQSANVVLSGELDLGSAPKLRDCLAELARAGVINLVMDLANLTFLDSTGISLFVTNFKRSTASGGSFAVRNAPTQAMRVLEITGLVELLSVSALDSTETNCDDG